MGWCYRSALTLQNPVARPLLNRLMLLKRITEPAASPGGIALPADSANLRTEGPVNTDD
jgi:hypothetical protein